MGKIQKWKVTHVIHAWEKPEQPLGFLFWRDTQTEAVWAECCSSVRCKQNDNVAFKKLHCIY